MSLQSGTRWKGWIAGLALAGLMGIGFVSSARAADVKPWSAKTQWVSLRFGYAKSAAVGAADGNVGYGFGYTRFRNSNWAFGAHAEINVLGRYGRARELEIPWTFEVTRHYKWNTPLRPYLGVGAGAYYHQISGTGSDATTVLPGGYLAWGLNAPVSDRGLLGFDVRANSVRATAQDNPVFGGAVTANKPQSRVVHWSAKVGYSWAF